MISGERTLVPIRAVIEALGGSVEWNEAEREVVLTMNSDVISLTIDSDAAYLNGEERILDTAPVVIIGRTMLPIRFIAEGFGLSVDWDEAEQSITIVKLGADADPEAGAGRETQNTVLDETEQAEEDDGMISINVIIGGVAYGAKLYDNETAREWIKGFPAEYEMSELNGNEKYCYLQGSLPTDGVNPGGINAGDIMLYGSSCIVLFYDTFQTSYSYTRLGYIEDPDGLAGVDAEKYASAAQARSRIIKPYRDRTENKYQWCIAAAAGNAWAKKVFPGETAARAEEKLWEAIISTSRADGNPVANWNAHNADLAQRCARLNSLRLASLEYESSNGTRLKVGLMPEGRFAAGREKTLSGVEFNPNIPSEEVFTSPKRGEAEGIVYSTKPLSYQGQLIRNFSVRFEEGRAVEVHASQGEAALKKMISADEGAAYLGECALVPYDSPISRSGVLFYNTLFDENAACHLALGKGFPECVEGFGSLSEEKLRALGLNDSMIHVDFMIGNEDMKITGITEQGARVRIFENGNWASETDA